MRRGFVMVALFLAGCADSPPGRDTLPIVHVTCLGAQGPLVDSWMTRAQFERITFQRLPCVFEWGEQFPVPAPSITATPVASPTALPTP